LNAIDDCARRNGDVVVLKVVLVLAAVVASVVRVVPAVGVYGKGSVVAVGTGWAGLEAVSIALPAHRRVRRRAEPAGGIGGGDGQLPRLPLREKGRG